ncbi:CYTH and CHAD domain-containing protein [Thalassospira sp. TSL5-1]|uniref:CYTH and CHAD domain-containing protein n=1 Tax=Thalassospira sp. TSL5-1 TaxID=1544451 RepID=UPI00093F8BAF|nr:CYTH and CHAD domain-containing protein [Thalassospira sp. TSL5-1]OKH88284.1 adenylate cyclase [Thalassospira sp. TSL5-1]
MAEKQIEIELKMRIDPKHVNRLKQAPVLREVKEGRRLTTTQLVSIYYDTPKLALSRKGLAIRVRKKGNTGWEQTVKASNGLRAALPERQEWTVELENGELDLAKFTDADVLALLDKLAKNKKIDRIFETDLSRSSVDLGYRDAVMELAIDQGVVRAGDREAPISEVELELKEGHPATLFDLALELQRTVPLYLSLRSKASRGRALYFNEQPSFYKAVPVGLHAGMSAEEAFRAVIAQGLTMILGNEICVRQDLHPEGCHQMRIGMRRLRVAFSLFRHNLPSGEAVLIRRLLKICTKGLDALRDWDVFLDETLPAIEMRFPDRDENGPNAELRKAAEHQRALALKTANAMLDSPDYQQLCLLLGAWSSYSRWASGASATQMRAMSAPVGELAEPLLEKARKRIGKRGCKVTELSIAGLHAWRLDVKQMRYACDFFYEIYSGKSVRKFRNNLAELQDILGQLNDAAVAENRLAVLQSTLSKQGMVGVGRLAGWYGARADYRLQGIAEAWKAFDKQKPFWR